MFDLGLSTTLMNKREICLGHMKVFVLVPFTGVWLKCKKERKIGPYSCSKVGVTSSQRRRH